MRLDEIQKYSRGPVSILDLEAVFELSLGFSPSSINVESESLKVLDLEDFEIGTHADYLLSKRISLKHNICG